MASMASWLSSWIWTPGPSGPARVTDAVHNPALRGHFIAMLDHTELPQVFKASEVAQLLTPKELAALGYADCREAIPAIRELAFEMRELGYCEILQKGKVLGDDVDLMDIEGPIRIRRMEHMASGLTDDW